MRQLDNQRELWRLLRPEGQPGWLRVLVVVAFVAVTGLSVLRVARGLDDPVIDDFNQGLVDFHNVVYFPAIAYRDGVNPYSAEYAQNYPVNRQYPVYSPAIFWLNYPFGLLPIRVADVVYYVMSFTLVMLLAVSTLVVCRVQRSLCNVLGLATLILISRSGHINLWLGQVTLPMVLGAIWALELGKRRPELAGLALALTTIKPTFGVPLVWLMFCRGNYRAVFAGVAIAGAAAVAGLAPIVASHGWESVLGSMKQSQSLHENDPVVATTTTWTRLDALPLIGKLLGQEPAPVAELVVAAACLLIAGAAVWRIRGTESADGADSLSSLIICTTALACIYHSTYDGLLLVVPWVGAAVGRLKWQLPAKVQPIVVLLLTVPAVNYLAAREFTRLLSIDGSLWTVLTMLNSACVLAALILSIAVAVLWSPQRKNAAADVAAMPADAVSG